MPQYRRRPTVIEARQLTRENVEEVAAWCGGRVVRIGRPDDEYVALDIPTLNGLERAATVHSSTYRNGSYHGGDYVIRGVKGEFYPCKPDIFEATYEPVEEGVLA